MLKYRFKFRSLFKHLCAWFYIQNTAPCHNLPLITYHLLIRMIANNDSVSILIYKCTWNQPAT